MAFKKWLKNRKAQAVVEYIVVFTAVVVGIILAFGGLNRDSIGIRRIFSLDNTGNGGLALRIASQLNEE